MGLGGSWLLGPGQGRWSGALPSHIFNGWRWADIMCQSVGKWAWEVGHSQTQERAGRGPALLCGQQAVGGLRRMFDPRPGIGQLVGGSAQSRLHWMEVGLGSECFLNPGQGRKFNPTCYHRHNCLIEKRAGRTLAPQTWSIGPVPWRVGPRGCQLLGSGQGRWPGALSSHNFIG